MRYDDLMNHPEGGRFLEIYRSATPITTTDHATKTALTHIYFSLNADEVSRFHRVASDEVWNLYQGSGVMLYQWDGRSPTIDAIELSAQSMNFCHVIPARHWQAAAPLKDRVLVGCSVAPGFEYADFDLIDSASDEAQRILSIDPSLLKFIQA